MSAEEMIGRRRGTQREKWIQDRTWKHIDDRKNIKKQMEEAKTPEQATTTALKCRELDRQVKKSCRANKKVWLEQKGAEAQEAATKKDTKALYRLVREMAGTRSNSNIPIRDKHGRTLIDKEEQNARWVEHFKEALNQPNPSLLYDFTTEQYTRGATCNDRGGWSQRGSTGGESSQKPQGCWPRPNYRRTS